MTSLKRRSPVTFTHQPAQTAMRNGWEIVLKFEDEIKGPFLIDLSHIEKWDIQGEDLPEFTPGGLPMPKFQGHCSLGNDLVISRVKLNWATIWQLTNKLNGHFQEYAYTNVTEAYTLLALVGREIFSIMETVTSLDLQDPERHTPFLLLGPVLHVRSQIVVLNRNETSSALLLACSRGYGQAMADALLDAGEKWGLKPGGENVFSSSLASMSVPQ
ncbi:MAG: sarcosine oxidase subunit gamma SoxG [Desulfobacterales bacterium]|nr:sarcosine oxidase subunit gamma SoxG [Desulfobacterales bacterium]